MSERVCAIHQPNFFPWLGYFDKIARADVFILLDNVQFPKTGGGTWCNRVKIMVSGRPEWITIPVDRSYHGVLPINEIKINNAEPWRNKMLKTIQLNYGRAPFFESIFPLLEKLINNAADSLAEFNICGICSIMEIMEIDASKLVLGSTLNVEGRATDLLISMVEAVGCTAYMCGGGAGGYQEDDKFDKAGIGLLYQNFQHPVYPQMTREFIPGLSVIDALFNIGPHGCSELLKVS